MTMVKVLHGKPYAGNSCVRHYDVADASRCLWRFAPFCKKGAMGFLMAAVAVVFSFTASAGEVSPDQAKAAARAWLAKYGHMEETRLGALAEKEPTVYKNADGRTLFYVIDLEGGGYVVASANTKIAPVVMFTDQGTFDPNPENPAYAMLTGDMADRLEAVDEYEAKKASTGKRLAAAVPSQTEDEKEWAALVDGKPIDYGEKAREALCAKAQAGGRRLAAGESTLPFANEPDGLRAPQMIRAIWNQAGSWNGIAIENHYTPDWRACGCVATAYAQVAHYWRWPKHVEPIENHGQEPFYRKCAVDGVETNLWLKGGDYNYDLMPGNRGLITSAEECEAIGRLIYDTAVVCGEHWVGGGAGSSTRAAKAPFVKVFGYANGLEGWPGLNNTPTAPNVPGYEGYYGNWGERIKMTLDALLGGFDGGMPATVGVDGHSICAGGYRYVAGKLYVLFNFGWTGSAWYSFLNRDESLRGFNRVRWVSQNIHPTIPGIVFSGRVYDAKGNPVVGATVELDGDFWSGEGKTVIAHTNAVARSNQYGMYHFRLQYKDQQGETHHDGRFTVKARYAGLVESEQRTEERSKDWILSGSYAGAHPWKADNVYGVNLTLSKPTGRSVKSISVTGPAEVVSGEKAQFAATVELDDGTKIEGEAMKWSFAGDTTSSTVDDWTGEVTAGAVFGRTSKVRATLSLPGDEKVTSGELAFAVTQPAGYTEDVPDYFVEWAQPESALYVDTGVIGRSGSAIDLKMSVAGGGNPTMAGSRVWDDAKGTFGQDQVNIFGRYWGEQIFLPAGYSINHGWTLAGYGDIVRIVQTNDLDGVARATLIHGNGAMEHGTVDLRGTEVVTNIEHVAGSTYENDGEVVVIEPHDIITVVTNVTDSAAVDTKITMYLFATHYKDLAKVEHYNDRPVDHHFGRLYHFKAYHADENGEYQLVGDFRPCVKDGVVAMYDSVTKKIHYPQGGGKLKAGPIAYGSSLSRAPGSESLHGATVWGKISYGYQRDGMYRNGWRLASDWRDLDVGDYAYMGVGDIANLGGNQTAWQNENLRWSQVRFDGWFNVSADKAGTWEIRQGYDDYFAFFIDGELVLNNGTFNAEANATVEVSEGWHRFTIVAGDTYGGYGGGWDWGDGVKSTPMAITVNGAKYAFSNENFPQGTDENKVTLTADADWSALGIIQLDGTTIDLNGHNLTIEDVAIGNVLGASIVNTSSTRATLAFTGDPAKFIAEKGDLIVGLGSDILVSRAGVPAGAAVWTGAAGDGDASNMANWQDPATGEAVEDLINRKVSIAGTGLEIQAAIDSAAWMRVANGASIGDVTLAADCDWSALPGDIEITGTVNLNGHKLTLPWQPTVKNGGGFISGGVEGSEVAFALPHEASRVFSYSEFKNAVSGLNVASDVRYTLAKLDAGEMDINENGEILVGNGAGDLAGYYQTAGVARLNAQPRFGASGGDGVITVVGGSLIGAAHWVPFGNRGGTGELNVTGDGNVEFQTAIIAGNEGTGNRGTLNVSGNGKLVTREWIAVAPGPANTHGVVNLSENGSISAGTAVTVGESNGNTGRLNINGGSLSCGEMLQLGWYNGSKGYLNITNGNMYVNNNNKADGFSIGRDGYGEAYISGSANVQFKGLGRVGWGGNTGTGYLTMDGGTLTALNKVFVVGDWGRGYFTQNGGDVRVPNADFQIGQCRQNNGIPSAGVYTMNGGTLQTAWWTHIGWYGEGIIEQNGGTITATGNNNNWICIGSDASGRGTYLMKGGELNAYNGVGAAKLGRGEFVMDGGTVSTPVVAELTPSDAAGSNTGVSAVGLGGGTLKLTHEGAKGGNKALAYIDKLSYIGGFTLDTNGRDVEMTDNTVVSVWPGSSFAKAGDGTLTVDEFPAADTVKVQSGTLALASSGADRSLARLPYTLAHRWSFNDGTLADSVTGSAADVETAGTYEVAEDGTLRLPGGGRNAGHVDLGTNRLPSDSVTVEMWATLAEDKAWTKLFCIGSGTGNILAFTFHRDSNDGIWSLDVGPDGGTWVGMDSLKAGVPYYFAMTLDYDGSATHFKVYCFNAETGAIVGTIQRSLSGWRLTEKIPTSYFVLGYSFWNDHDAAVAFDEVRVWNGAFTTADIWESVKKGANAKFDAAYADAIELGAATEATLAHRWTFDDGTLADSVTGSAEGTRNVGDNEIGGGMLHLPGGAKNTKHVDLGANPITTDSASLEFWFTPRADTVWTKLFCLGRDTGSVVTFTMFRDSNGGPSGVDIAPGGGTIYGTGTLAVDAKYYAAMTFDYDEATGTTVVKAYCYDADTGAAVGSISQTLPDWRLTEKIDQTYFCLGASFWNDPDAAIDVDEVRVWNGALSPAIVYRNLKNGPGVALPTSEDGNQNVAVLDLGGKTLERSALSLKSGTLTNGTLRIAGTVAFSVGDYIVNKGALDLTGSSMRIADSANLRPGVLIKCMDGGVLTGLPRRGNLPKGWYVQIVNGDLVLTRSGTHIILR